MKLNIRGIFSITCSMIILTGCATSSMDYAPPPDYSVKNQKIINEPFDSTWKKFLQSISGTFFVINNIEKDSGIINVSFSAAKPSDYVDCGVVTRTYWGTEGSPKYVFNYADSQTYLFTSPEHLKFVASRQGKLDGRVNILFTPENSLSTKMTVNAIYTVSVQEAYRRNAFVDNSYAGSFTESTTFTSQNPSNQNGIICKSRGILEKRVLDSAK